MKLLKIIATSLAVLMLTASAYADKCNVIYTPLGVPNINTYFKTYEDRDCISDKSSDQYKFIEQWGWCDGDGFWRTDAETDLGIADNYYLVAMGSYYGTEIGTKYRVTLDTGRVIYCVLGDQKDDRHTNSTNQYANNNDVLEFIITTSRVPSEVRLFGSCNVYMPLNGNISSIERIDFNWYEDGSNS